MRRRWGALRVDEGPPGAAVGIRTVYITAGRLVAPVVAVVVVAAQQEADALNWTRVAAIAKYNLIVASGINC